MSASVLILNAGYEPLQRVSVQHAITMLYRKVAVIEIADETQSFGNFPTPRVVRLTKYISMKWRHNRTPIWSRNKLLQRDSYACAYCTRPADTVDHILPVSQGGTSTWLNTVASCRPCNAKKRNRTPSEAHMPLNHQPFVPDWHHLYETAIPYNTAALAS